MNPILLRASLLAILLPLSAPARAAGDDFEIRLTTLRSGYDGNTAWMNPILGAIPRPGRVPLLVLTLQKALLNESDVYFTVNDMLSEDFGRTWTPPAEQSALGRRPGPDGMQVGIISVAPKWHAATGKLLAIGGTSFFVGNKQNREGPKRPGYSVFNPASRTWTPWVALELPDEPKFHMADPGCCQRLDLPDGTILQPVYFKAQGITAYSVTVLRLAFDGTKLTYLGHGDELTLPFDPAGLKKGLSFDQRQFLARQSGLWEPSLTLFQGRYLLTLRNVKDGYVTEGRDGQHFEAPRRWRFDDGGPLGSENTQTHWVSHGDRLYLVYTRREADNDNVFRHRAPLFIVRVDPRRLCLIRATERILIPNRGAGLGNCIGVTVVNDRETWVTTAESMQDGGKKGTADHTLQEKLGANNRSYAARIIWKPAAVAPVAQAEATRLLLLQRPTCRISLGDPGEDGAGWPAVAPLPAIQTRTSRTGRPPGTTVRALALADALCVRFDCETTDPLTLTEGAKGGDRVWIEIYPRNDPVERLRFEEDFRGDRKMLRLQRITGENSLEVVPDLWEGKASTQLSDADVPMYHGLKPGGWYAEFVISWKALGLHSRPAALGFDYGRNYGDAAPRPAPWVASWPEVDPGRPWAGVLEPGQALIGDRAEAPLAWETAPPRFGPNTGRLIFSQAAAETCKLAVETDGPQGGAIVRSEAILPAGATSVEFNYELSRAVDSHLDVFHPQRVVLKLTGADGGLRYAASVPFGRHLGVCVEEPYGERSGPAGAIPESAHPDLLSSPAFSRESTLQRIEGILPRLSRRTTQAGAPSDFCLVYASGAVAANLMADDAWTNLAEIVESRFTTTEDRLVAAMALIGQKSVTNLITDPLYFVASGAEYYHSAMVEMLGPLSVLRYGGGTAAARAAVLARLLQHMNDPATGRPFVTRIVSLTASGGPSQVDRHYPGVSNLAGFVEVPGRVGAVAVDYRGSQTLLDPTALAFFPAGDHLATLEEIRGDEVVRREGAGRLSEVYGRIDLDEIRHEPVDRLLSRGVFPEQAPEEDGQSRPYEMGYRFHMPALTAGAGPAAESGAFVDEWLRPGVRTAKVRVEPDNMGWKITVAVRGVDLARLDGRDRKWERVHLLFDGSHGHFSFLHFTASAAGIRGAWLEESDAIQTFSKHLATENWRETAARGTGGWKAGFNAVPGGYDAVFEIPRSVLGLDAVPPVIGFNAWVEGRAPHYEQLFLAPPSHRLPADPMTFADLYTSAPPAVLASVDLGVPTWMDNTGTIRLENPGAEPAVIELRARDQLSARRHTIASPAVMVTVPAHGVAAAKVPFFLSPEEKMETDGAQRLVLEAAAGGRIFYRSTWRATYAGPISVYQRYGTDLGPQARPAPGEPYYVERMIRWMSSRLPKFKQLTTRDGAESDFVLQAEDGSARFNLMDSDVFDRMAAYVENRFPTDFERLLALYCLDLEPSVGRHNSGGHHLMVGAQPVSILRGNFCGGGGNCGFHSALFAGLAAHLRLQGRLLGTRTVSVWAHDIMALDWRGSRILMDDDSGNLMFTPDGKDFATIDEFRANPWLLSNAGPGEIGRYYSFSEEDARTLGPGVGGVAGPGVFPEGLVARSDQPGVP